MDVISKEIKMIVYFDTNGSMKPIKFRIEEDNTYKVIKIDKVISTQLEDQMIVYKCSSIIGDIKKKFEVKYDAENFTWVLWNILNMN